MKTKWLKTAPVIVFALLLLAPPCWAKAKGYFFVVGYSLKLKKLYYTPIFTLKVGDVSYSATEYVAEVGLIRKIESQFQNHLAGNTRDIPSEFAIAARGAFKNQTFAVQGLAEEKREYATKGFEVLEMKKFQFQN